MAELQKPVAIGALERITETHLLDALRMVRSGRIYDLGMELNERIPQGNPGAFVPFSLLTRSTPEETGRVSPFQYSVEAIIGTMHVGTHIDAFVHVQADGRIYGGGEAAEVRSDSGWTEFGMETVAPILGRCVILDVAGMRGDEALPDGYQISVDDLQRTLTDHSLDLRSGDVVLVRTGKIREFHTDSTAFQAGEPGVGPEAAIWLYEQGMAVLGTDTTGTEALPFPDPAITTHKAMLVERGVHLIENVFLDELCRDDIREALFICLPLKITGATGSWVRPVAIV